MMFFVFFFNDTATTEIYTLSLHDALPISIGPRRLHDAAGRSGSRLPSLRVAVPLHPAVSDASSELPRERVASFNRGPRSEEHTSELQSRQYLVCRLLLEKKKKHADMTYNL